MDRTSRVKRNLIFTESPCGADFLKEFSTSSIFHYNGEVCGC
jgi:hypothetical protein